MSEWKKTADVLPAEDCSCFVFYKGTIRRLCWNEHYKNWDTEDGDDYFCDAEDVSHWMTFDWPDNPCDI